MVDESTGADANTTGTEDVLFQRFREKLGADAIRYVPSVVAPAVLGVVGVAIFTRVFAPGPYGEYALAVAVATMLVPVLAGWLKQSTLRYLPRYVGEDRGGEFLGKLNALLIATAVLVMIVSLILRTPLLRAAPSYARFYWPVLALAVAWMFFLTYAAVFQARLQSTLYTRFQVSYAFLRLAMSLVFVFFLARDTVMLVLGMVAAYAALVFPMARELGLLGRFRSVRFDRGLLGRFLRYGMPVVGWTIASRVLELSDRFVLAAFRGPDEVGVYSANYNLTIVVVAFIAQPFLLAADALVINAWEGGVRTRISEIITEYSRYFLIAAVPVVTFVGIFSGRVARLAFGEGFREGHLVIPLVATGLVIWHFGMYGQKGIKLVEKTGLIFGLVGICAGVNIVLNLIMVPRYGYLGAAAATLASYALYPIMIYRATKPHIAWVLPWRTIARLAVAALAAVIVWMTCDRLLAGRMVIGLFFVVAGVLGLLAYVASLVMLRELSAAEQKAIKEALRGAFRRDRSLG